MIFHARRKATSFQGFLPVFKELSNIEPEVNRGYPTGPSRMMAACGSPLGRTLRNFAVRAHRQRHPIRPSRSGDGDSRHWGCHVDISQGHVSPTAHPGDTPGEASLTVVNKPKEDFLRDHMTFATGETSRGSTRSRTRSDRSFRS